MIEEEDATVFQTEGEKLRNSLEMDDLQLSILCQTFKLPFNIDTVIENGKYNFIYHFPYQTLVELVERTK
jgi:hypothetical protein